MNSRDQLKAMVPYILRAFNAEFMQNAVLMQLDNKDAETLDGLMDKIRNIANR